jgi:thioredoxin-dependent peroxiredoxin
MATTSLRGNPTNTVGDLPAIGSSPAFSLTKTDLSEVTAADLAGKKVLLSIFPSLDTAVCATAVRTFNQRAASLDNTVVLCVSADLPFAQKRFCGAEGIENVQAASTFRSDFGQSFGLTLADSALNGLLARAVIVLDESGTVTYTELVPEISQEPDYDAAIAALG